MAENQGYLAPHERLKAKFLPGSRDGLTVGKAKTQADLISNVGSVKAGRGSIVSNLLDKTVLSDIGITPLKPTGNTRVSPLQRSYDQSTVHHLIAETIRGHNANAFKTAALESQQHSRTPSGASQPEAVSVDNEDLETSCDSLIQVSTIDSASCDDECLDSPSSSDVAAHVTAIVNAKEVLSREQKVRVINKLCQDLEVSTSDLNSNKAKGKNVDVEIFESDTTLWSQPSLRRHLVPTCSVASNKLQPPAAESEGPPAISHNEDLHNIVEGLRLEVEDLCVEHTTMKAQLCDILVDKLWVNEACFWCEKLRDLLVRIAFPGIHD